MRRVTIAALIVLAALFVIPSAMAGRGGDGKKDNDTRVQILGFNDFHGHVEPNTPGTIQTGQSRNPTTGAIVNEVVPAGGAEYLATHVKALRTTNPNNTITVGSGDLIGASPLLSGLFHDEPAIEALNEVGLDVSGVGNHEFDEGLAEIYRMMNGGCHPVDGCQDGTPFLGSVFGYLAANVFFAGTDDTILPPYEVRKVGNAKIAFIGMTLEGTPLIVTPSALEGLEFRDEVETVNNLIARLKRNDIRTFVVLLHEGGFQTAPFSNANPAQSLPGWAGVDNCDNLQGAIVDIAKNISDEVDVIVSGHTHAQYICKGAKEIDGKLVTSAASFGRLVTDIDLVIDHESKQVKSKTARNVIVTQDVPKDAAVTSILNHYRVIADPIANRVVGSVTQQLLSTRDPGGDPDGDGEAPLGNVIADAQLEATAPSDFGGAVIAFMNPGGIRGPVKYEVASGLDPVTYGELFTVQPFSNTLTVKTCTGAQIQALLEQQFDNPAAGQVRILTVSRGFNYSYNRTRPAGDRVLNDTVKLNGSPIVDAQSYRVEMNSFLATGGDGFSVFNQCTNQLGGEIDLDALVRYFQAHSPISPPAEDRIVRLG